MLNREKLPDTKKTRFSRPLSWLLALFILLLGGQCSTAQISESRLKYNVLNGSMDEYEIVKKQEEVEVLSQPCIDKDNCDTYESPTVAAGKYRVSDKLSKIAFAHLIKSAEECSKQLKSRNTYFFGKQAHATELGGEAAKKPLNQNRTTFTEFQKRIAYHCNCNNEEKGQPRQKQCVVPIYDATSDMGRVRIDALLDSVEQREKFAQREKIEKAPIREETTEERITREKAAVITERNKKRTKKLAERALKSQYDYIYKAFLCRNDEPMEIVDTDNGELVQCVEGIDQNNLKVETNEEYYYRVTLRCTRAGNNYVMDFKTLFRTSKDGKIYSFVPHRIQRCDDGSFN